MIRSIDNHGRRLGGFSVKRLSNYFGYNRSYYYKAKHSQKLRMEAEDTVLQLVHRERHLQPRLGAKKVLSLIKEEVVSSGIKMGRDKFYKLMNKYDLLLKPKRRYVTTTNSKHLFQRYDNLLLNRSIGSPNEVYVCDITYLSTLEGFVYLCLIMDAYSRKVVGWHMHDTLEVEGCLKALSMAIKPLSSEQLADLVHHSDHGIQYCCGAYRKVLHANKVSISMAEVGNCYQNAQAERLNGILKQEYGLGGVIRSKALALKLCKQAISLYNTRRPHISLQMCTPQAVHSGQANPEVRMSWSSKALTNKQAA